MLPMALEIGFPVGIGMLFATVLPSTPTHNGKAISAGNAETPKAIEKEVKIVNCFMLEENWRDNEGRLEQ